MTSGVKFQSPFRKKVENTNMSNFKRTVTFSEQKCNYRILILKETVLLKMSDTQTIKFRTTK